MRLPRTLAPEVDNNIGMVGFKIQRARSQQLDFTATARISIIYPSTNIQSLMGKVRNRRCTLGCHLQDLQMKRTLKIV
jgi:hypothetical protein